MPPPPPPPPPPPMPGGGNVKGNASNGRGKLLGEIQSGFTLRKTVTNDRSSPLVGGNTSQGGRGGGGTMRGGSSGPQGLPMPQMGGGGLFANGMPKKPSDNKKFNNGGGIPLRPALPLLHKQPPSQHPDDAPKSPRKPSFGAPHLDTKPSSAPHLDAGEGQPSRIASRLEHFNQRQPSSPAPPESETSHCPQPSWTASRGDQFNQQNSRPPQAPPTPPSAKSKPALPGVAPVKKFSSPNQFQTLRNTRTPPRTTQPPMRRSGSFEEVRSTPPPNERPLPPPLPANPPSSVRIKPLFKPPPPPVLQDRGLRGIPPMNPPPLQSLPPMPTSPLTAQFANFAKIDDDEAPPPPPLRGASCASEMMDKFVFIPLQDLPPPPAFTAFRKVYDVPSSKKRVL